MEEERRKECENLGRNIARYRKESGLTQSGLVLKANLSRGYLSQIEVGNIDKTPLLGMLFTIAKALNVPVYRLFMRDDK